MEPIKIFYCCTNTTKDKELRDELEKHLMTLKRLSQITLRLTRDIMAGTDWNHEQNERFQKADLILLLVSPDFVASDYHFGVEMRNALEKHHAGNVLVIPILLRPTLWEQTLIGTLSVLPKDQRPITQYPDRDEALVTVVKEISQIVIWLLDQKLPTPSLTDEVKLPIAQFCCVTCGKQNAVSTSICEICGDLLRDISPYNITKGVSMSYIPKDIKVLRKGIFGATKTASFILTNKHTVICTNGRSNNYRLYVDGKEVVRDQGEKIRSFEAFNGTTWRRPDGWPNCRFQIEEVDCFLNPGFWGPKLEVGGTKIF